MVKKMEEKIIPKIVSNGNIKHIVTSKCKENLWCDK
jgi:hypothetical protein